MTDLKLDQGAKPKAGRPTDERKTAAILDAARTCFFADGVPSSSIEHIAELAGVSKVTVYSRFGDKAGLMEALVKRQASGMRAKIAEANRDAPDLETKLINFGCTLAGFLFSKDYLHIDAMLTSEASRHPELASRFFDAGPATMRAELSQIIVEAVEDGEIQANDPVAAAEDLIALWRGFQDVALRFRVVEPQSADQVRSRVVRGTEIFFKIYRS